MCRYQYWQNNRYLNRRRSLDSLLLCKKVTEARRAISGEIILAINRWHLDTLCRCFEMLMAFLHIHEFCRNLFQKFSFVGIFSRIYTNKILRKLRPPCRTSSLCVVFARILAYMIQIIPWNKKLFILSIKPLSPFYRTTWNIFIRIVNKDKYFNGIPNRKGSSRRCTAY